eukprot:scaffold46828_cov15-Prasinocladus_malaysianus.AAC.1
MEAVCLYQITGAGVAAVRGWLMASHYKEVQQDRPLNTLEHFRASPSDRPVCTNRYSTYLQARH